MSDLLPIHESFFTWQGEGVHMGKSAFFIRTFGCPVHCPWCDSAGTWHKDYIPEEIAKCSPEELANQAAEHAPEIVVVTGGEPTVHDLAALTEQLHSRGLKVHLETSGAFPIKGEFDWVTVSPKWWKLPLSENLERADELKIIVEKEDSISRWIEEIGNRLISANVWLHPEWSRRADPAILNAISNWVKTHGAPYRAGYQMHKLYRADALDKRTQPLVPLGGDHHLGF